jgi:hypothetical protein
MREFKYSNPWEGLLRRWLLNGQQEVSEYKTACTVGKTIRAEETQLCKGVHGHGPGSCQRAKRPWNSSRGFVGERSKRCERQQDCTSYLLLYKLP